MTVVMEMGRSNNGNVDNGNNNKNNIGNGVCDKLQQLQFVICWRD